MSGPAESHLLTPEDVAAALAVSVKHALRLIRSSMRYITVSTR